MSDSKELAFGNETERIDSWMERSVDQRFGSDATWAD
jgi:hypothetical protein